MMPNHLDFAPISLGAHSYLAYPHCNIWGQNGRFVWARASDNGLQLHWQNGIAGDVAALPALSRQNAAKPGYYDVAHHSETVVAVADNALWALENGARAWRQIYRAPQGFALQELPGICADGTRAIVGQVAPDETRHACVEVNVASGEARVLFEKLWRANHFQFCPHDENWIGFSHEEWPEFRAGLPTLGDRMWAFHPLHAPQGELIWDGQLAGGAQLDIGHERWSFADTSALVVAYKTGAGGPKGVYEVGPQNRAPRLIIELPNALHVDGSRDGKWLVVDTAGILGQTAKSAGGISDIVLIEKATGERRVLARARFTTHPYHAHPTFSADGKWIFYNDAACPLENGAGAACALNIEAFL